MNTEWKPLNAAFEKWWQEEGQYCRAGGSDYEKTFAYRAFEAALAGKSTVSVDRWKRDSELLEAIQDGCWDVRFLSSSNGDAGDYNIGIEIVAHFMEKPQERVIGEDWNENLRTALEQAMTAEAYPPARPAPTSHPIPTGATGEDEQAQRDAVMDAIAEALGDAYDCTRVWSAWGVGTMSQDDFCLVTDDAGRLGELADAAIAAMTPAPAAGDALDAARYRWLRSQDNEDFEFAVAKNPHFDVFGSPEELDAAIDAAIAQQKGEA